MKIRNYCIQFWPIYLITIICFFAIVISADHAVATYSENIPIHRSRTIVIDAGHGGEDGGAISCTGIFESHINLEIAKRLNDLLNLLDYKEEYRLFYNKSIFQLLLQKYYWLGL